MHYTGLAGWEVGRGGVRRRNGGFGFFAALRMTER